MDQDPCILNVRVCEQNQPGMDGEAIFFTGQGGLGRGKAEILRGKRGGEPPPPHSAGRGGEGVKIFGAGRCLGGEHTVCTD